jgi:chemotaxis protein MotA
MEMTSILGLVVGMGVVLFGLWEAGVAGIFLNLHGIVIVLGGTIGSVVFHCEWPYIKEAARGFIRVFSPSPYRHPQNLIPILVSMAEKARQKGPVLALREAPSGPANGFLAHAADVALQNVQSPELVKVLLERGITSSRIRNNEISNVFRTASVLSPMFGLLGTLIGIIGVLRNIASPDILGASMAVAITSAFYGIGLANLICVPVAGKLRTYAMQEQQTKTLILEGIMRVLREELPLVVEQRLWAFLNPRHEVNDSEFTPRTNAEPAIRAN